MFSNQVNLKTSVMKKTCSSLLAVLSFMFSISSVNAQIFLKATPASGTPYPVISGGSTAKGYENQINVEAYSLGIAGCPAEAGHGAGAGACKTSIGALSIMMQINSSVIPFKYYVTTGKHLPSVDLAFLKTGGENTAYEYYKIHMEDVVISSMQESASGNESPQFSVELNALRIAWAYIPQNDKGGIGPSSTFAWDVAANKSWNYTFPSKGAQ
jgi:type VI secretion system secreted protein Hcp